jgi:hypothetical protein
VNVVSDAVAGDVSQMPLGLAGFFDVSTQLTSRQPPNGPRTPHRTEQQRSACEVVEEFGCWLDASHQQMVAGASAFDVKQVALAVIDFFEIGASSAAFSMPSSSHALTATARNSRPFARCMVPTGGDGDLSCFPQQV